MTYFQPETRDIEYFLYNLFSNNSNEGTTLQLSTYNKNLKKLKIIRVSVQFYFTGCKVGQQLEQLKIIWKTIKEEPTLKELKTENQPLTFTNFPLLSILSICLFRWFTLRVKQKSIKHKKSPMMYEGTVSESFLCESIKIWYIYFNRKMIFLRISMKKKLYLIDKFEGSVPL